MTTVPTDSRTDNSDPAAYERDRDALLGRVLGALDGAFEVYALYFGERLGYYRALAAAGDAGLTAVALADVTSTHPRYAREWLEQQAVTGVLVATGGDRFRLPAAHAEVLADRDSLHYLAPIARLFVGAAKPIDRVLEAFRSGGGVPFGDYGPDLREGQAEANRAAFLQQPGPEWLAAVPDVDARLRDPARPARVADIG